MFYLTDGDLSKIEIIKKMSLIKVFDWYYNKRVNKLNEMLDAIAHIESLKDE